MKLGILTSLERKELLTCFREVSAKIQKEITSLIGSEKGKQTISKGAGGDTTLYLDYLAEKIIFSGLEELCQKGFSFIVYSEEFGEKVYGSPPYFYILADPVDGSLNAKRGLPLFAVSLAVLTEMETEQIEVGYVRNLVDGDEYYALKGEGAYYNGRRLNTSQKEEIEMMAFELGTKNKESIARLTPLFSKAPKIRFLGTVALDLCYVAAGVADVSIYLGKCRPIDYAAPLLIAKEAGAIVTNLAGGKFSSPMFPLKRSDTILAAGNKNMHEKVLTWLLKEE